MFVRCLDDNGIEIKEKNCNIKSYLFSLDKNGRGTLDLNGDGFKSMIFGVKACFSDDSCAVFRTSNNVTFVVSDG